MFSIMQKIFAEIISLVIFLCKTIIYLSSSLILKVFIHNVSNWEGFLVKFK